MIENIERTKGDQWLEIKGFGWIYYMSDCEKGFKYKEFRSSSGVGVGPHQ